VKTSFWTGRGRGTFDTFADFGRGNLDRHSMVVANIVELSQPQGEELDFPFQGDASMEIRNLVPLDSGQLHLRVEIDFDDHDLNFRVGIAILSGLGS
jgi:hypothetical protein